jgi:hypothetical protein
MGGDDATADLIKHAIDGAMNFPSRRQTRLLELRVIGERRQFA